MMEWIIENRNYNKLSPRIDHVPCFSFVTWSVSVIGETCDVCGKKVPQEILILRELKKYGN